MILQNFTFPRAIALLDEIPYPPEKIAFLDLETKAYGRKNSHIPVSYTHLTLPTKA